MKTLSVNKSRIPEAMWNDPSVLERESQVLSLHADPEARKSTCVHEAAHEIYLRKLGIETVRRGPFAFLDEDSGECEFAKASVCIKNSSDLSKATISDLAKAFAVGSVAARELTAFGAIKENEEAQNDGPGSDFDQFSRICKFTSEEAMDKEIIRGIFDRAKTIVESELKSLELRAEIWRVADDFEKEVFGPYFEL